MIARQQRGDESVQIGVGEREVRATERRYHLDAEVLEVRACEHDDNLETFHPGFTEDVDLSVVCGSECGEAKPPPVGIPAVEPQCVGSKDLGIEIVAADDDQGLATNDHQPDSRSIWHQLKGYGRAVTAAQGILRVPEMRNDVGFFWDLLNRGKNDCNHVPTMSIECQLLLFTRNRWLFPGSIQE